MMVGGRRGCMKVADVEGDTDTASDELAEVPGDADAGVGGGTFGGLAGVSIGDANLLWE